MGPLSGKQQREYMKFAEKEKREAAKAESEESRKQELHEIKLQEAAAKANQALGHKEDAHSVKMSESGGPLSRKYSVGAIEVIPVNYMKQGGGDRQITGHATGGNAKESHPVMPSDTVPAMLTPGEAVIPKEAAQIPANKEIIQRMVNQGREIQGHATGTINVRDNMPSLPIIGVKRRGVKGYAGGAVEVDGSDNRFRRQGNPRAYDVVPPAQTSFEQVAIVPEIVPQNTYTEKAAVNSARDTPTDTSYYQAVESQPRFQQRLFNDNKREITAELKNLSPNDPRRAIFEAELVKLGSAPAVPVISAPDPRIAELQKIINGPYPANDKGKARMELEGMTGTSKQGAYKAIEQGTIKPDGTYVVPPVSGMSAEDTQRVLNGGVPPGTITTLDQYNASKKKLNPNFVPGPQVDVLQLDTVPNQPPPLSSLPSNGDYPEPASIRPPLTEENIAKIGQANDAAIKAHTAEIPADATHEQKVGFFQDVLNQIYGGPDSMFNQKDLIRFVGGAAFRMATGDTLNGALRAASYDVMNVSDKRHAVEQNEKMAQNRLDSAEEKALRNSLLSQQYSPERVEAYLKAKKASEQKGGGEIDPNILGDAKTTTRKVGKPEQYTFSSGPLMGQQFPAQKHEIMTGKRKGDEVWTVNGIPVEDFAGVMAASNPANKHAIGSAQFVPYSDGAHGPAAITTRYKAFETDMKGAVNDIYSSTLGSQDVKGKANEAWSNMPTPDEASLQARQFFRSRGDYNPDDSDQKDAMRAIVQRATRSAVDMNKGSGTKVKDITPYLAQEIILGNSGVDKGAFMVGNTPMAAGKIASMDDNLRYSIHKSNPKANPTEVEQLKAKKLRDLYFQYNQEKPIMGSDKESGFYQYVTSKLK